MVVVVVGEETGYFNFSDAHIKPNFNTPYLTQVLTELVVVAFFIRVDFKVADCVGPQKYFVLKFFYPK